MDYRIVIRSYKRVNVLMCRTLPILKRNFLLSKTIICVQDESELEAYKEGLKEYPELNYKIAPRSSAFEAYHAISILFPERYPLLFLDDDLIDFFTFDDTLVCHKNACCLDTTLQNAFQRIQDDDLGSFTFNFSTNKMYVVKPPKMDFMMTFIYGGAFGVLNNHSLFQNLQPLDDCEITARLWTRFGGTLILRRAGFRINVAESLAGGSSDASFRQEQTRLETTKLLCEALLPKYPDIFAGIK